MASPHPSGTVYADIMSNPSPSIIMANLIYFHPLVVAIAIYLNKNSCERLCVSMFICIQEKSLLKKRLTWKNQRHWLKDCEIREEVSQLTCFIADNLEFIADTNLKVNATRSHSPVKI
uniref:Uncharacterized protein n=1 Tax=Glossina palpalis gambiensis TaxID=67801 RepID=A0A1B0C2G9_9MUSC